MFNDNTELLQKTVLFLKKLGYKFAGIVPNDKIVDFDDELARAIFERDFTLSDTVHSNENVNITVTIDYPKSLDSINQASYYNVDNDDNGETGYDIKTVYDGEDEYNETVQLSKKFIENLFKEEPGIVPTEEYVISLEKKSEQPSSGGKKKTKKRRTQHKSRKSRK